MIIPTITAIGKYECILHLYQIWSPWPDLNRLPMAYNTRLHQQSFRGIILGQYFLVNPLTTLDDSRNLIELASSVRPTCGWLPQNLVPNDGFEPPSPDYKTGARPTQLIGLNFGSFLGR